AEIQKEGQKMQTQQQEKVRQKTEKAMENWIEKQVAQTFSVKVVAADVKMEQGQRNIPQIAKVYLTITEDHQEVMIRPVEPVEPVDEMEEKNRLPSSSEPEVSKRMQAVKRFVIDTWSLSPHQVDIK